VATDRELASFRKDAWRLAGRGIVVTESDSTRRCRPEESPVSLQIGLYAPTWHFNDGSTPRWPEIRALARDAEALGVDTLWVADEPGFWECWTILTAVSGAT